MSGTRVQAGPSLAAVAAPTAQSLAGLTREQLAAVTHSAGPLLVSGGAGTGKTEVLIRRCVWLVEQGVPADAVLVLAGSEGAAEDMRVRLETLIDAAYEELSVYTPHGLCARLLREEALEAGVDPSFTPVIPAERVALLLERIGDLSLRRHEIRGNPAPLLGSFVSRIDRLKEEMVTPEECRRHAESRLGTDDAALRGAAELELEFAHVYAAHDRLLKESGALDFGDLLLQVTRLLHLKPHVRRRVSARFQHVLVDEHQDLNFAEGALLRLITGEHGNVTVADDPRGSLRRFRGAAEKNQHDFRREHPAARIVELRRSHRARQRLLDPAVALTRDQGPPMRGRAGGHLRFWRCRSPRAEAQAVAREVARLVTLDGVAPGEVAVLVSSVEADGAAIGSALEEQAVPFRLAGASAYFHRAEVRDILAWLRLLTDPFDAGAVVRALSRPPVELRSVDIARVTQLSRRRKLDMVSGVELACEGPQLSPEGRERAISFLRLHRSASAAFDHLRPDAFVHRLIERIGLRRRQLFAAQAETAERLVNIAKLGDLAAAYGRRYPQASARDFARYCAAVAESGLPAEEAAPADLPSAVRIMATEAAKGLQFDHVFLVGVENAGPAGSGRPRAGAEIPDALLKEALPPEPPPEQARRRLLYVGMTRARRELVVSFREAASGGRAPALYEEARAATETPEELFEEALFGPAEGLQATFRMMRDEVLGTVSNLGGRLSEMRLDTYLDVSQAVGRYLELIKVAALIERGKEGQDVAAALPEVNELLLQGTSPEQRESFRGSALDDYLLDSESGEGGSEPFGTRPEPSLDSFIPRRGDGLMLSASDIETYRICPLKYKFARVFRIPQEPTINQRFGIVIHQVLEHFHAGGGSSFEGLMQLFESSWRRSGFGDSDDERQFRRRARSSLRDYWEADQEREGEPAWFERSFSFKIGSHLLRGRVDRVDRLPGGGYELIDYKTGRPKTAEDLRQDIQLSIYQMGARESWQLETSAQSYYYVLDNEKVPVEHSQEQLDRVRATVSEIGEGIMEQAFEPRPSPEICPHCDYRIICPAAEK